MENHSDFLSIVKNRRSIRNFDGTGVSNEAIQALLDAARWAPSAGNSQECRFVVVKSKTILERMADKKVYNAGWIKNAPLIIAVCAKVSAVEGKYGERGRDLYSIQDTAAAIQNILLCAQSLGLASCWIGAYDEKACQEALGLEKDLRSYALIAVGHSQDTPAPPRRREIAEITTFLED